MAGHRFLLGAFTLVLFAVGATGCSFTLGSSAEGRPILMYRFGSGPNAVLLVGGLHTGYEDNSRIIAEQIATYFDANRALIPDAVTLYIVPSANPDGTALGVHTNARGVDLNRNWPADDWVADACHPATGCRPGLGGPEPLSEPETRNIYEFIDLIQPAITLVWHAEGPLVEANESIGADTFARTFADAAGYEYIEEWTAYPITGQLIDALEQRLSLRAMDVELSRCCSITQDEFDRNLRGLTALLDHASRAATPSASSTPAHRDRAPKPRNTPRPTVHPWATQTPAANLP